MFRSFLLILTATLVISLVGMGDLMIRNRIGVAASAAAGSLAGNLHFDNPSGLGRFLSPLSPSMIKHHMPRRLDSADGEVQKEGEGEKKMGREKDQVEGKTEKRSIFPLYLTLHASKGNISRS